MAESGVQTPFNMTSVFPMLERLKTAGLDSEGTNEFVTALRDLIAQGVISEDEKIELVEKWADLAQTGLTPATRYYAILAVEAYSGDEYLPIFIDRAEHDASDGVRRIAMRKLRTVGYEDVEFYTRRFKEDSDRVVRTTALAVLEGQGFYDEARYKEIARTDVDPIIRMHAVRELQMHDYDDVAFYRERATEDGDVDVQYHINLILQAEYGIDLWPEEFMDEAYEVIDAVRAVLPEPNPSR